MNCGDRKFVNDSNVEIRRGAANWFWMVRDPERRCNVIGVAASRAEAISSARIALVELRERSGTSSDDSAEASNLEDCWCEAERQRWAAIMAELDGFLNEPPLYAAMTLTF